VINCNFQYGSAMATAGRIFIINGSGPNLTVKYSVLDGNGPTLGSSAASQSALINYTSGLSVEYCLLENFNQHAIEFDASVDHTLVYQFNLVYNGGSGAVGQHLNYLQFGTNNCTTTVTCNFNTTYQPSAPVSGGEGFQFYSGGVSAIQSGTLSFNTMIYDSAGNGRMHVTANPSAGSGSHALATISTNYIFKGSGSFWTSDVGATGDTVNGNVVTNSLGDNMTYVGNIDISTGNSIAAN